MNDFDVVGDNEIDSMDFTAVADLPEQVVAFDGTLNCEATRTYKHTPAGEDAEKQPEKKTLTLVFVVQSVAASTNEAHPIPKKDARLPFYFSLIKKEGNDHARGAMAFKPLALQFSKALNVQPTMAQLLEKVKDVKCAIKVKSRKDSSRYAPESGFRVEIEELAFPA